MNRKPAPSHLAHLLRCVLDASTRMPPDDRTTQAVARRQGWGANSIYTWLTDGRMPARWRIEAVCDDCGAGEDLRDDVLAEYDAELLRRAAVRV